MCSVWVNIALERKPVRMGRFKQMFSEELLRGFQFDFGTDCIAETGKFHGMT